METIRQLSAVNLRDLVDRSEKQQMNGIGEETPTRDFSATIADFLDSVNDKQKEAAGQVNDVIQGRSDNLHEAMTHLEEASLSFQLMIEIRNKLLEGYKEIERMQV